MKPLGKVKVKWSPNFAYSIGLIATDGNLSSDGRHIVFVSKDREQVDNFQEGLQVNLHVGIKANGINRKDKKYYVV
ncbi:hypothetical protein KKA13_03760 [Patescibacteria group bacterium]|nr:hypothetical protein [Patescibacteria group bacterium]